MTNSFLKLLSVALGSWVAAQLFPYFKQIGIPDLFSLILSTVTAVSLYKTSEFILIDVPLLNSYLRPYIDSRALVEGYWLEIKRPDELRPYALLTISYNKKTHEYSVKGNSYNCDGRIGASWSSSKCLIDIHNDMVLFVFHGTMHDGGEDVAFEGYTMMSLEKDLSGKYKRGTGYFIDTFAKYADFSLDRLDKKLLKELIGKTTLDTHADIQKMIVNYHNKYKIDVFEMKCQ